MPQNLSDAIESLFRGVVFILFSYVASLGQVLRKPWRSTFRLNQRQGNAEGYGTRPYVFVFISAFIALTLPRYLAELVPYSPDFDATHPWSSSVPTKIQHAYARAVGVFEARSLLKLSIAAIALTILMDGLYRLCSKAISSRRESGRRLLKGSLLYTGGAQLVLISIAVVGVFWYFSGWAWSTLGPYRQSSFISTFTDIVRATWALTYGWKLVTDLAICAAGGICFVVGLLYPLPVLVAWSRKQRRLARWARRIRPWPLAIATSIVLGLGALVSYEIANWIVDSVQPDEENQIVVSDVTCFMSDKQPTTLRAVGIIQNRSDDPWLIRPFDVDLVLRADADTADTTGDPIRRRHPRMWRDPGYRQRVMHARITNAGGGGTQPAYFIAGHEAIWIEAIADSAARPVGIGENLLYCGISLPNFDLMPIEGFGNVIAPTDSARD
jgi:hypothetical protein